VRLIDERPRPGAHNIWEFTLHAAYWKYVVRRRITGEKRGSFVLEGSNFFERPVEQTEADVFGDSYAVHRVVLKRPRYFREWAR
jgi:hypothetical protein